MFANRKVLIATKHAKEQVIAPLFESRLGVSCFVSEKFDTDTLGTFTGEIPRKDDALTTLRAKCRLAMEKNHCELVIASEGSFGAHPSVFFAAADDELMMLMDARNDLEIVVRHISMNTNFDASLISNEKDLLAFAEKVHFPSHGLILKSSQLNSAVIIKGIVDTDDLKIQFEKLKSDYGCAYIETDMRAKFNPTRMRVIEETAQKLLEAVTSRCPNCDAPGFTVSKALPGLPCDWCKSPTESTISYQYTCKKCDFEKEVLYPHQKMTEDPTYCNYCNP